MELQLLDYLLNVLNVFTVSNSQNRMVHLNPSNPPGYGPAFCFTIETSIYKSGHGIPDQSNWWLLPCLLVTILV